MTGKCTVFSSFFFFLNMYIVCLGPMMVSLISGFFYLLFHSLSLWGSQAAVPAEEGSLGGQTEPTRSQQQLHQDQGEINASCYVICTCSLHREYAIKVESIEHVDALHLDVGFWPHWSVVVGLNPQSPIQLSFTTTQAMFTTIRNRVEQNNFESSMSNVLWLQ